MQLSRRRIPFVFSFLATSLFLVWIVAPCLGQSAATDTQTEQQELQTLNSFKKHAEHPLFEMHFHGDYQADKPREVSMLPTDGETRWACSIFVVNNKDGSALYGRNFDWQHNPALLLHTHPSDGYASISMVDISYLGFENKDEKYDTVEGRRSLLSAPMIPFDGMNEHGLTVGMAAVNGSKIPNDEDKPTVGSLQIIRLMLDRARTVDEALALFDKYNIDVSGGPQIHYLIADENGHSALVELKNGDTNVIRNDTNWQSATNFYMTDEDQPLERCPRFAKIHRRMSDSDGNLTPEQTFGLLKNVSQGNTQWSVVYDIKARTAQVVMGRKWDEQFAFNLKTKEN